MSAWGESWGSSWLDAWGEVNVDPGRIRGTASGSCTVSGTLTSEENLEVNVSWVEFNPVASVSDTRVSWVEFNPVASVSDVRVSWVQFNPREAVQAVSQGAGRSKRKRVFMEKDGKIYVFNSNAEAALFLTADKQPTTNKPKRVNKKVRAVTPQIVDIGQLRTFYEEIEDRATLRQIDEAISEKDIETLIYMYEKLMLWQEEQDLLILLLAA